MSIKAASLNCLVTIIKPDDAPTINDDGETVYGYSEFAQVWAHIKFPTGIGVVTQPQDGVPMSINKCSIRIRYREDINPNMRVTYKGQVFDVRQVLPDYTYREYTDLVCEVGGRA